MLAWRRFGIFLATIGLFWVTIWSLPPVSDAVRASLEQRFENRPVESIPQADAIVVLGGGERGTPPDWPYPDLASGADRIWHTARLYRAGKAERVIVTGGRIGWHGERRSGTEAMRELLVDLGVPESAILIDDQSRSTRENAVEVARIVNEQELDNILLVTSALHMRRALATFRAAGLNPIPATADFEVLPEAAHALRWLPDSQALHDSTRAIKEYLGYWVYRLRGWAQ